MGSQPDSNAPRRAAPGPRSAATREGVAWRASVPRERRRAPISGQQRAEAGGAWTEERSDEGRCRLESLGAARAEASANQRTATRRGGRRLDRGAQRRGKVSPGEPRCRASGGERQSADSNAPRRAAPGPRSAATREGVAWRASVPRERRRAPISGQQRAEAGGAWTEERSDEGRCRLESLGAARAEASANQRTATRRGGRRLDRGAQRRGKVSPGEPRCRASGGERQSAG